MTRLRRHMPAWLLFLWMGLSPAVHAQGIFEQIGNTINNVVNEADKKFRDIVPIQIDFRQGGRVIVNTPTNSFAFTPGSGAPPLIEKSPMLIAIENLPGQPLAQAIWASKSSITDSKPVPDYILRALSAAGVPRPILTKARYSTDWGATANFTLQQIILGNGHAAAVTLDNIIVFRDGRLVNDLLLWAHELKHVEQYNILGVEEFATRYTLNSWVLENEAIDYANEIWRKLLTLRTATGGFAYFYTKGFLLYADPDGNVYPAHPVTGQVIGPAIGRVQVVDGIWWLSDVWGMRHQATKLQTRAFIDRPCMNGVWEQVILGTDTAGFMWKFALDGNKLNISRADGGVSGTYTNSGVNYFGQVKLETGQVLQNAVLTPDAMCTQVRTNQGWLFMKKR